MDVGPEVVRPDSSVPEEIALISPTLGRRRSPPACTYASGRRGAFAARGLADLAESEDAGLIVIGSSPHAEAGRIRLERTAGRLLERAPCAVAIAPGGLRERAAFRHIAVAYDDSSEARGALEAAYDIAASCAAAVTLVHALPPTEPDPVPLPRRSLRSQRLPTAPPPA